MNTRHMTARSRRRGIQLVAYCLVLGSLAALHTVTAVSAPRSPESSGSGATTAASAVSKKKLKKSKATNSTSDSTSPTNTTTTVLQLTETEVYLSGTWKAAGKAGDHRWTDQAGTKSKSPDQVKADVGTKFVGDWKIVTGPSKDAFGWEYTLNKQLPPSRRRTWLRTMHQLQSAGTVQQSKKGRKSTKATAAAAAAATAVGKKRTRRKLPAWMQLVRDDFNFKGFGWTFYKSFIFKDSYGVAFRLPLTFNFDTWERNPALPSLSSSVCLFHPGSAILFLNASLRVEWIKAACARAVWITVACIWAVVGTLLRGLLLAASALAYPVTRKVYDPEWTRVDAMWPSNDPVAYSRVTEERLGASFSWRVSYERGYEFRLSYWHYYAPAISHLVQTASALLPGQIKLPAWFARHSAAIGMSTSAPMPDPPHVSCTGVLSLSGFYFQSAGSSTTLSNNKDSTASVDASAAAVLPTSNLLQFAKQQQANATATAADLLALESSYQETKAAAAAALTKSS